MPETTSALEADLGRQTMALARQRSLPRVPAAVPWALELLPPPRTGWNLTEPGSGMARLPLAGFLGGIS